MVSLMSSFVNNMSPFSVLALASASMSLGSTCPSCFMECCGAISFRDSELTEGSSMPWTRRLKDRSRIARNFLLLWGIMAIGEILSFGGGACEMVLHGTIFAYP